MRSICAIFAGLLTIAAFGGASAYAQDTESRYWVNPALSSVSRAENAARLRTRAATQASDDLTLGFTLPGTLGVQGRVELGHATLGPGTDAGVFPSSQFGGIALNPVDERVGEATIEWNITPRFQINTSVARGIADPARIGGVPAIEDSLTGEVTYSITPRFAVNARGIMSQITSVDGQSLADFSGDTAGVGAEYEFLPYFTGSVNYTYESFDGEAGVLRHDESTLSLSLTGRF